MFFEETVIGMTTQTAPVLIEKETMLAFARVYDSIPLHTDEQYAKTTPFGGLISPGIFTLASIWAKYAESNLFGDGLLAGKSMHVEWIKAVYPDDVLTARATVTDKIPKSPQNGLVEITIEAFNQKDEQVMTVVAQAIVKCKSLSQNG